MDLDFSRFRLPFGEWVDSFVEFLIANLQWLFDAVAAGLGSLTGVLEDGLTFLPAVAVIAIVATIAYFARGWKFALYSILSLMLIVTMGMWDDAMSTLSLVLVATALALVIGVPLGICSARSDRVSSIVRPVLDFMQTMPSLVYLIPAIIFFGVGKVPGVVATFIFATPPAVRLTELGLRQVDEEIVEAGEAFGAAPWKILTRVQIPLALPTIMSGVNQVIMLALSMVVIAGMVGAGGLGAIIFRAVTRLNVGLGFEGGLSIVVIAVLLDRLTVAFSDRASRRVAR